ncbi:MAG: hypothetical protein KGH62_03470, partial [Candidatus Micrarchaeota archaeon]|nr:hypothetical protein [Candidatus Micrarchaeota archaeon]
DRWKSIAKRNCAKNKVSYIYTENANHVLKHEETSIGKLSAQTAGLSYNASDSKLDEEAVNAALGWLDAFR